jgi:hypothetical protein
LASARRGTFDERRADPEGEQHPSAAEVTDKIQRRDRRSASQADAVKDTTQSDVVDVVPSRLREWSCLAPARHSRVNEPRIAREAYLWSQAEPFHHSRPEALLQDIGRFAHAQHKLDALGILEIYRKAPPPTAEKVRGSAFFASRRGSIDEDHFCSHIGEHHGAKGTRADARDLNHFDSG